MTNTRVGRAVTILFICAAAATCLRAAEPNEVFAGATVLAAGAATVSDGVESAVFADTVMGAFTPGDVLINFDDDASGFGDGFASGLFDIPVNADGSLRLRVSGFDDFDFDGFADSGPVVPHPESGDYDLVVTVRDGGGEVIDFFSTPGFLQPGFVDPFVFTNPGYVGGAYDAQIDNTTGGGSDVDFWRFTGFPAGLSFIAEITAGDFDTYLGHFDDQGAPVSADDDGGAGSLSRLTGITDAAGEAVLAVTGFPDFDFFGAHGEAGTYTLDLTVLLPGDGNNDEAVTAEDLLATQQNFASIGPNGDGTDPGDANDDGTVTAEDLLAVQQNFGATLGLPGAATPLAEPEVSGSSPRSEPPPQRDGGVNSKP